MATVQMVENGTCVPEHPCSLFEERGSLAQITIVFPQGKRYILYQVKTDITVTSGTAHTYTPYHPAVAAQKSGVGIVACHTYIIPNLWEKSDIKQKKIPQDAVFYLFYSAFPNTARCISGLV